MPTLEQALLDHDFTLLRAIAGQAGMELAAPNARAAALELAQAFQQPETFEIVLARVIGSPQSSLSDPSASLPSASLPSASLPSTSLPSTSLPSTSLPSTSLPSTSLPSTSLRTSLQAETQLALAALCAAQGRFPVAAFTRRFGEVRPLGPVALAREKPWESPTNAAEALFFNGLLGRAFMESETGPQEFFFIPAELIPLLPPMEDISLTPPLSQTVAPVEIDAADVCLATSILIDDAVTLLAAVQRCPGRALTPDTLGPYLHLPSFDFLLALLTDLQFITPEFKLDPERVKTFLQAPRAEQLRALAEAWRSSKTWNDLLHIPTLSPEPGAWLNDPAAARSFLVRFCATLPAGERSERSEWRSLDSFVACVREQHPDFQRPAGNYDSWYIRDDASGDYLRGFENWDRVDGALIRYLLTGPMYWLGLVDLRGAPDAFRLSAIFSAFAAESPWQIAEKPKPIIAKHDGALLVARNVNRYDRFQAARIGEWVAPRVGAGGSPAPTPRVPDYEYRLTGNSLQAAAAQGITAKHVTSFLRRACEHAPQHIIDLVERWGRNGIEARVSHLMVIKLNNPDVLETLMRSPRTRRWLGEAIGDCAAEVKDWEKLREAMAEIGLAAEFIKR